jgi:outer membrane protein TolC
MKRSLSLGILLVSILGAWLRADDLLIRSVTLDEFTEKAIQQGIEGKENELGLQTAGYTREIAFRKTDSPTFNFNHSNSRGETIVNGSPELTNAQQSTLTMNELTPLGTNINANGQWATAGGTLGAGSATVAQPGLSLSVTQPLYLFVKNSVLRARKIADLNFANAKDLYDMTVLSLRTQAHSLYYSIMLGEESIKVDERKVASSQKLLEVTQALIKAGKSAAVDSMRAKLTLQDDERQLQNDQVIRDQAILNAKNFIFWPLDQPLEFTSQLQFSPFDKKVDRLIAYAKIHNPQLHQLQRDEDLARLAYEASVEPTRPTFSLAGTYNDQQTKDPSILSHGWSWTGEMNWLFFDSFVTRDQARQARIAQWVADLNTHNAERTIEVNIRNAYLEVKRTEKQLLDFQTSRDQTQKNVEIVRIRFKNGLDRLIDVFDAETQMRTLDNEYLNLLVSYNQAKDNLSQLVGADVESVR